MRSYSIRFELCYQQIIKISLLTTITINTFPKIQFIFIFIFISLKYVIVAIHSVLFLLCGNCVGVWFHAEQVCIQPFCQCSNLKKFLHIVFII